MTNNRFQIDADAKISGLYVEVDLVLCGLYQLLYQENILSKIYIIEKFR